MTISFITAQIIGAIALCVLMLSFQKNSKETLLKYQIISSLLYAIQYIFLKAYTGSLMNLTCMLRNCIFKVYDNKKEKVPLVWLIVVVIAMVVLSLITLNGWISFLPMIGVISYSIALWIGNLKVVRVIEVFSCILFIIYNIKVLAITGLIATVIEMIAAMVAIYKFDIRKCDKDDKHTI